MIVTVTPTPIVVIVVTMAWADVNATWSNIYANTGLVSAGVREHREIRGTIVESSDDAIVIKDLNGIITSWNRGAARLFGYTAQDAIGKSVTIVIPPPQRQFLLTTSGIDKIDRSGT
jgi:PAS domain-containing protein